MSNIEQLDNIPNPYNRYRLRREDTPVHHVSSKRMRDTYTIYRYQDVANLLISQSLSKVDGIDDDYIFGSDTHSKLFSIAKRNSSMFRSDPPAHARLRKGVGKFLAKHNFRKYEEHIEANTASLVNSLNYSEPIEVVNAIASKLPIETLSFLLGIPTSDRELLLKWVNDLAPLFEGIEFIRNPNSVFDALCELDAYLDTIINRKKLNADTSLISGLLFGDNGGTALSDKEIKDTLVLLLVAGTVTTTDFICNGIYSFWKNPEIIPSIQDNPLLLSTAIEEILRCESPIQITGYISKKPLVIQDVVIPESSYLALCIGSANRDPRRFHDPDKFNLFRKSHRNLCFGGGVHMCVGAGLARYQGLVLFRNLLSKCNCIELAGKQPKIKQSLTHRGFLALTVLMRK